MVNTNIINLHVGKKLEDEKNNGANFIEVTKQTGPVFLTCNVLHENGSSVWYIDIECNNHMCGKKNMFIDLDENVFSMDKFGDDRKIVVKGKNQILIKTKSCDHHTISNVFMFLV